MPAIFLGRFYYLLSREKNGKSNATNYLLPNQRFNIAGKILTVLFVLLVFIVAEFNIKTFDTLLFLILPCLLLWIGSKEKNENDQVNEIRLKAMQLSVYISYSLYFIATWLTYGWDYLMAQIVSLVAVQVIFLVIFYYLRYRASKEKLQTT